MDKEYMLYKLKQRLVELETQYKQAVLGLDLDGKELKASYALLLRAKIKRDIQILLLIEQLLITSKLVYITNEDAIDGFMKLVEPRSKVNGNRSK